MGYRVRMIHGAHVIIYSKDAEAEPPAEVAVHPSQTNDVHEWLDHAAHATGRREARGVPAEARVALESEADLTRPTTSACEALALSPAAGTRCEDRVPLHPSERRRAGRAFRRTPRGAGRRVTTTD